MKIQLKNALASRHKLSIEDAARIPSAVLVPIFEDGGQHHIIFIRRTQTVKTHKGQISFPGGVKETTDRTLLDTAIRESTEEIGLHPEDLEVLGELDDEVTTTSNYIVTPFVAAIPWPYRFTTNTREVDEIIAAPLSSFQEKGCLLPAAELLDGKPVASFTYHYQGLVIWGATARILHKFLDIIAAIIAEG